MTRFAHEAEVECARALDALGIRWAYEPHTFVLDRDEGGRIREAITPDFHLPDQGLYRGQVGTVVETLAPGVFEVEFSDDEGRTYASVAVPADQLLPLRYEPVQAA